MSDTFRAMCAELVDALAEWRLGGGPPEDTADADLIQRARALLAQPVADAPSLKMAALGVLSRADKDALTNPLTGEVVALRTILNKEQSDTIRRALEALND